MERAPDLWSSFMRFSQKAAVVDHVTTEPVFCLSDFYFGTSYSWIVTLLGSNPDNTSEYCVYDLAIEPESLVDLTETELINRLGIPAKPVRRLRSNACPVITPVEDAPAIAVGAQLGIEELSRRAEFLRAWRFPSATRGSVRGPPRRPTAVAVSSGTSMTASSLSARPSRARS
jgi:exodeoxyribonuclease I